jgi:hypothetical protein
MSDFSSAAGPAPLSLSRGSSAGAKVRVVAESPAWRRAIVLLVLIIWLIPIKSYRLPVNLPFNLELYRLLIIALLFAWLLSSFFGRAEIGAGGLGPPMILLALAVIGSLFANRSAIDAAGGGTQSIKSLSFLLSFVVAFVLVYSTLRSLRDIDVVIRAIAIGAFIVAIAALVERRTNYNVFNHLHTVLPFLQQIRSSIGNERFGRLRVVASSQHPIALGVAFAISAPLALYCASRASSRVRHWGWIGASLVILASSVITESRTVVTSSVVMLVVALRRRPRVVARQWPLIALVLVAVHLVAPHTLGGLYHAFRPSGGLLAQQQTRAGESGSGRVSDIGPGLRTAEKQPLFGQGVGTSATRGGVVGSTAADLTDSGVIYDDEYLRRLVETGFISLMAVVWIVWGSSIKMGRTAKQTTGRASDLLVAGSASAAGFATAMFTFDAFAFVQVTLLFFVIAALGLRARSIVLARAVDEPSPS